MVVKKSKLVECEYVVSNNTLTKKVINNLIKGFETELKLEGQYHITHQRQTYNMDNLNTVHLIKTRTHKKWYWRNVKDVVDSSSKIMTFTHHRYMEKEPYVSIYIYDKGHALGKEWYCQRLQKHADELDVKKIHISESW